MENNNRGTPGEKMLWNATKYNNKQTSWGPGRKTKTKKLFCYGMLHNTRKTTIMGTSKQNIKKRFCSGMVQNTGKTTILRPREAKYIFVMFLWEAANYKKNHHPGAPGSKIDKLYFVLGCCKIQDKRPSWPPREPKW